MRYRQITQIGQHYNAEVGSSGVRTIPGVWMGIQNRLQRALLDLSNAIASPDSAPTAPPVGGGFAAIKAFHEAQSKFQDGSREAKIAAAKKKVQLHRAWLAKEGASADDNGNVIMAPMTNLTVYYDTTANQQGLSQIHIHQGRLYMDAMRTTVADTREMVTHFSGPGYAIFVMSPTGNIHIGSHVVGHYHHSSLLAGNPVSCAGEIKITNGWVAELSNKSGHYCPNPDHLIQVLHQLTRHGVVKDFPVKLLLPPPATAKRFRSVAGVERWLAENGWDDYELTKLMAYSAHINDVVLAPHNLRWRFAPHEKAGIYDATTNQIKPHKEMRKWFKSRGLQATNNVQSGAGR